MTAPNTHINVSGTWKSVNKMYVKVSGTWKEINKSYVRVSGVWKQVHAGVVPGSTTYTTPGTYSFTVPKHNTLTVKVWGAGGSGASNTENGETGGTSSWNGTVIANGGRLGTITPTRVAGAGGTASGGSTNVNGGAAGTPAPISRAGVAADSGYGDGGSGAAWFSYVQQYAGGGGGGAYSTRTYSVGTFSSGSSVTVIVGAGGTLGQGSGEDGRAEISWS